MAYIGVDIGGTKIAGALFDGSGNILYSDTRLIEGREGVQVGELVTSICSQILSVNGIPDSEPLNLGLCVPGIAYSKTGIVWAPNIPGWDAFPLKGLMLEKFPKAKVTIESDRTCYILGEVLRGAARGCENAIFIAVGTGIGAGILIDGKILHGASDIVGATGWMALKTPYSNEYDSCGCFETYASGSGIALQASNITGHEVSTREVFADYKAGEKYAIKVIEDAIEMWGMAAANFVSLFNPEMIVFGGGVFGPATEFIDRIYSEACKWAQPISIKQCKFVATELGTTTGLYGAGAIAIKNY